MSKWDARFMQLAQLVSTWSKDPSTKVGAVIVDADRRIVSCGYNGAPKGCIEPSGFSREQKLYRTIHAEANALHFAGDVKGCTIYITAAPCANCAGHIIQRGITRVVYIKPDNDYGDRWHDSIKQGWLMFAEAGISTQEV
jgi:dCMP deaminase